MASSVVTQQVSETDALGTSSTVGINDNDDGNGYGAPGTRRAATTAGRFRVSVFKTTFLISPTLRVSPIYSFFLLVPPPPPATYPGHGIMPIS